VEPRLASAAIKTWWAVPEDAEVQRDGVVLPLDLVDVRDRLVLTHRRLHRLVLRHCTSSPTRAQAVRSLSPPSSSTVVNDLLDRGSWQCHRARGRDGRIVPRPGGLSTTDRHG
jgi:hypothetical protein